MNIACGNVMLQSELEFVFELMSVRWGVGFRSQKDQIIRKVLDKVILIYNICLDDKCIIFISSNIKENYRILCCYLVLSKIIAFGN
jgi:hypothetical protein